MNSGFRKKIFVAFMPVAMLCGLGLVACTTTSDVASQTKRQNMSRVSDLIPKIAENLPEMTYAQYTDCSIVASVAEKAADVKARVPVLRRSAVWDLAAQKRSDPKTVSLNELLEEPKLMPMLKVMAENGAVPATMQRQFATISADCHSKFNNALSTLSKK